MRVEPEVVDGYFDRVLPYDPVTAAVLAKRTLTYLYNARPAWLPDAHARLVTAVAAAYGWPTDISAGNAFERLLGLNLERAFLVWKQVREIDYGCASFHEMCCAQSTFANTRSFSMRSRVALHPPTRSIAASASRT